MPEGPFCQIGAHLQFYAEKFCFSEPSAKGVNFGLSNHVHPCFVHASSESSGESPLDKNFTPLLIITSEI